MRASVVIPVWNGAAVIAECLSALYAHSGEQLLEVICVDNASADASAEIIGAQFPQARLLAQPINLGFAGGVNVGLEAAQGQLLILLNQDCMALPGWLAALVEACQAHPQVGIFGCTIFTADGRLNHTGAQLLRPQALSEHLTDLGNGQVRQAEFVTGAAVALRRETWERVGRFDEGFYPAYYEDSDYCLRARRQGIETAWVPQAQVRHLFSSQEWQADPYKHAANSAAMRFRFVSKHFDISEIGGFFQVEEAAVAGEQYINHLIGRVVAARQILRALPDILERRRQDLGESLPAAGRCLLEVGLTRLSQSALQRAGQLIQPPTADRAPEKAGAAEAAAPQPDLRAAQSDSVEDAGEAAPGLAQRLAEWPRLAEHPDWQESWAETARQLEQLRRQEDRLLADIAAASAGIRAPASASNKISRWLFQRLPDILSGRADSRFFELHARQVQRENLLERRLEQAAHAGRLYREELHRQIVGVQQLLWPMHLRAEQLAAQLGDQKREMQILQERLKLLELLERYDYR